MRSPSSARSGRSHGLSGNELESGDVCGADDTDVPAVEAAREHEPVPELALCPGPDSVELRRERIETIIWASHFIGGVGGDAAFLAELLSRDFAASRAA
jgi:hypothetical protein